MTNFQTVFLYLFIVFIILLLSKNPNNSKNIFIILILSFFAGLRHYSVGVDTRPYMISIESFFNLGKHVWPYTSFSNFYGYFAIFVYKIWHNYNFLLFIEALIINTLIVKRFYDFKDESSFGFMLFIYLFTIYLRTFNLNLQYLSLSIVFFATRYLGKNKNFVFLILVILASLLHTSACIGLLFYFVKWFNFKNITKNQMLIKFFAIFAGFYVFLKVYNIMYFRYLQYLNNSSSVGIMVFVQLFIYVITLLLYKKNVLESAQDEIRIKDIFKYYFIGILLSFSSYFVPNAGRIAYYFTIFEPIFYGYFMKNSKVDKVYKFLLIIWFIFYSIYVIVSGLAVTGYFPYKFCWM